MMASGEQANGNEPPRAARKILDLSLEAHTELSSHLVQAADNLDSLATPSLKIMASRGIAAMAPLDDLNSAPRPFNLDYLRADRRSGEKAAMITGPDGIFELKQRPDGSMGWKITNNEGETRDQLVAHSSILRYLYERMDMPTPQKDYLDKPWIDTSELAILDLLDHDLKERANSHMLARDFTASDYMITADYTSEVAANIRIVDKTPETREYSVNINTSVETVSGMVKEDYNYLLSHKEGSLESAQANLEISSREMSAQHLRSFAIKSALRDEGFIVLERAVELVEGEYLCIDGRRVA